MPKKKVILIIVCVIVVLTILFSMGMYIRQRKLQEEKMYEEKLTQYMQETATMNGKEPSYQNPIIPKGFRANQTGASWKKCGDGIEGWNEGLVIEDEQGNEFVWVPVENGVGEDNGEIPTEKITYKKWVVYRPELSIVLRFLMDDPDTLITKDDYIYSYRTVTEDTLPEGVLSEYEQIRKYGGFYIGRYEAGISEEDLKQIYSLEDDYDFVQVSEKNNIDTILPVSKKYAQPWNFIEYSNVKTVSEKMYQTEEVKSGLMTGRQFDTILAWAIQSGYPIEDSAKWGNHLDTVGEEYKGGYASYLRRHLQDWKTKDYGVKDRENFILTRTGGVESSKMNQIYDLAGNMFEFTSEQYKGEDAILRGGCAAYKGDKTSRHGVFAYDLAPESHYVYGFRVVLYVS